MVNDAATVQLILRKFKVSGYIQLSTNLIGTLCAPCLTEAQMKWIGSDEAIGFITVRSQSRPLWRCVGSNNNPLLLSTADAQHCR